MEILKDARRYSRYPTNFLLEIGNGGSSKKKTTALVTNISEGGFCFESDRQIEPGSSLTFQVKVPLVVQGGVVYGVPAETAARKNETRGNSPAPTGVGVGKQGGKYRYGVRFHSVRVASPQGRFTKPRTMVNREFLSVSGKNT